MIDALSRMRSAIDYDSEILTRIDDRATRRSVTDKQVLRSSFAIYKNLHFQTRIIRAAPAGHTRERSISVKVKDPREVNRVCVYLKNFFFFRGVFREACAKERDTRGTRFSAASRTFPQYAPDTYFPKGTKKRERSDLPPRKNWLPMNRRRCLSERFSATRAVSERRSDRTGGREVTDARLELSRA